jgi:hypothetical protein
MIMLTLVPPSNRTSSTMFFPTYTIITTMWRSTTTSPTSKGGPWRWVGWLLGYTFKTAYYFKSKPKCMSWPRVKVCLLLSNCWLISWNKSCFLVIAPLLANLVPIFGGPSDSYISGWLLGVVSIVVSSVYICWMTNLKVFCKYFSFIQSSTVLVFWGIMRNHVLCN